MQMVQRRVQPLSKAFRDWLAGEVGRACQSPHALALKAGVDPSQMARIMKGEQNATDQVLAKVAPHIGLTPAQLVAKAAADRYGGAEVAEPVARRDSVVQRLAEQLGLQVAADLQGRIPALALWFWGRWFELWPKTATPPDLIGPGASM